MKVFTILFGLLLSTMTLAQGRDYDQYSRFNPPSTGTPLVVNTLVEVGCRGRVAPISVSNLTLISEERGYMTFRGYNRVQHKCGKVKSIAASVDIVIHRRYARVNNNGVLLTPAVNADIYCDGTSDWIGQAQCQVVSY